MFINNAWEILRIQGINYLKISFKIKNENEIKIFFYEVWGAFNKYHHYVNIDKVIKKKNKIINFHKSQVYYKDYALGITGINHYHAVFNNFGKGLIFPIKFIFIFFFCKFMISLSI